MGWPIAGHLAGTHAVTVHSRTRQKSEAWAKSHGGCVALSVCQAAAGAEMVAVCLPNDDETLAVAAEAFAVMPKGAVFVDHGSGAPDIARRLGKDATEKGLIYVDAPVSGGRVGAERGTLAVFVGGKKEAFERVEPVFRAFAAHVRLMGGTGAGQATKMINVIIGNGNALAMAEGLAFAASAGLDPALVVAALMQGSSRSYHLEHRSHRMITRDYEPQYSVDYARKDLAIMLAAAKRIGAIVPISLLADKIYEEVQRQGFGNQDATSAIEYFTRARAGKS